MNILLFDILSTGHHIEYISHLYEYLKSKTTTNHYYFVVHQDFSLKCPEVYSESKELKHISFIEVDENLLVDLNVNNRFRRSLNNFKIVQYYASKFNIDECFLLYFNIFQIAIGLVKTKYKIKGILFMQFTNMSKKSLKDYYYYYRRYFPLLLAIRNKSLEKIFILNDEKSCNTLNNKFKRKSLFTKLPDPIPNIEIEEEVEIRTDYKISDQRRIFLLFGAISERKGVLEVLNSCLFFDKEKQQRTTILIVGFTKSKTLDLKIRDFIKEHGNTNQTQIIFENNFVSNAKMSSLFRQSDVILIPYKNPEASSGVLGHAMNSFKPVIAPSTGLIAEIVKKYKMGVVIDKITPEEISGAVSKSKDLVIDHKKVQDFIDEHTVENFAKTIFNN